MRASGFSAARITGDLSPIERMVHRILQPGSEEKFSLSDSIVDEDEDSQGASGVPLHIPGMANGRLPIKPRGMQHHTGMSSKGDTELPLDLSYNYDSAVPLTDLDNEPSGTEDQDLPSETESQSDRNKLLPDLPTADRDQIKTESQPKALSNTSTCAGSSSRVAVCHLASQGPDRLQEHLAKSASLSLQEQQATTKLIGTLSRSLESVAESVQMLVQAQHEFARSTLRLQRDTLHVLRDFSSSALALMQDKSNGRP